MVNYVTFKSFVNSVKALQPKGTDLKVQVCLNEIIVSSTIFSETLRLSGTPTLVGNRTKGIYSHGKSFHYRFGREKPSTNDSLHPLFICRGLRGTGEVSWVLQKPFLFNDRPAEAEKPRAEINKAESRWVFRIGLLIGLREALFAFARLILKLFIRLPFISYALRQVP